MIYAHIKSAQGVREEEWEDTRLKPEERPFVVDYNAYVIAFMDEDGTEQLGAVDKDFWDIYEEIQTFKSSHGGGTYPGFVALDKKFLQQVSDNFRNYLAVEKVVLAQNTVPGEQLPELNKQLDAVSEVNANLHNHLSIIAILMDGTPDEAPEREIAGLVRTLYGFTVFLATCIVDVRAVLEGLQKRAEQSADYSPLDYLHDLNELKTATHDRQVLEQDLTYARSAFKQLFP